VDCHLAAESPIKDQSFPLALGEAFDSNCRCPPSTTYSTTRSILVCGVPDSWKHSLLECNLAKCVWALLNEETVEHICNVEEQNAKAWLAEIISSLPKEESRRVVVTMWAVWHAKRKAVYENIFQSPLSTHCFVDRFMSDLDLSSPQSEITASKGRVPRWIPPPGGIVKINVDAALSKNSRGASAAAVARDASGKFMGASSVVMR